MTFAISDPSVVVNNEPVGIAPGTVKFTEGKGEQKMRAQSTGNGKVDAIYSQDVTTQFSMVKFELYNDIDSIEIARDWKDLLNGNVVTVTGKDVTTGKVITRTFRKAALVSDYEVEFGSESTFEVEFCSLPAV